MPPLRKFRFPDEVTPFRIESGEDGVIFRIDIANLPKGPYLVHLRIDDNRDS